ncbi:hypothetical protein FQN53_001775, partial [Emmonsiellopsis sp. PD_33]
MPPRDLKRLAPSAYTVAIICPLEVEMSAARFMLDEEHHRPSTAQGDKSIYIAGEIQGHKVVIASRPLNYKGTAPVATVASYMEHMFPSITLRLLLGIGGGVPSEEADVRIGDVVVSSPKDTYGGVV